MTAETVDWAAVRKYLNYENSIYVYGISNGHDKETANSNVHYYWANRLHKKFACFEKIAKTVAVLLTLFKRNV